MSHHAKIKFTPGEQHKLTKAGSRFFVLGLLAAIVGLGGSAAMVGGDWGRFGYIYLTGYMYFLTITAAALFFVIIQHLTRAGWSVSIRRIMELMAMNMPLMGILAIPILVMHGTIYHTWAHPAPDDLLMKWKSGYLNSNFFILRIVLYFVILSAIAWLYFRHSTAQDRDADTSHTRRLQFLAGPMIMLFALTGSGLAFDLLMTLDPHWFSTMYAVYVFGGSMLGFFAILILTLRLLQSQGVLRDEVTTEHYHDLGKWLFGFVFFWAYVAFSQYMLQWYANIPEETAWFAERGATTFDGVDTGIWGGVALALLFGHAFIPFLGLLSRWCKRILSVLTFWAIWLAVFHLLDLFWQVMPNYEDHEHGFIAQFAPVLLCAIGVGGIWMAGIVRLASDRYVIPVADPRLHEALAHENY
ncbi:MAG: quinol:cytochrome C oxidoreductase [Planctomycetes bacterium]|nr:quinol:cytochrome C oxidoreductase [Planctomycetota bacterium]